MQLQPTKISGQLAMWADQLRALAAAGLRYANNQYDQDRYQIVQNMAMHMLAVAVNECHAELEPLSAAVLKHTTPFAVGDAAVIDKTGRMLLIQRADNGLWAMPGGALEVGETPAAGVEREALEETGVRCRATALVGVFDSRLCGTVSRHHLYQFVFLCEPVDLAGFGNGTHAHEVLQVGWFAESGLPDDIDPGHVARIPVAFAHWKNEGGAYFDR